MKIAAFFLLCASITVSATGFGQRITISEKNAPLHSIFEKIEKQSDYTFAYTINQLSAAKNVSINVVNGSIDEVLNICFKDQPFSYSIIEKTIVVKPKDNLLKTEPGLPVFENTNIDITGRITDEDGNGLHGASVRVKGTDKGTSTDASGYFKLVGLTEDAVLEISYVGFEKKSISVATFNDNKNILALKRNDSPLNEVQIIAYGERSKRMQTGNVSTVKGAEIEKQPVANPLLALQGRVPGLFITQASGFSGSGVKVRIQGVNSIASGNDPLYVIDGVPYVAQLLPAISSTLGSSGGLLVNGSISYGNPLSYINPADIESIDVLKDADATAIYGSRAANGAILITTTKGKAGEQRVEFNLQQGWGKVTRRMDMLNLRQYLDMRYEALRNDGINLNSASATSASYYDLKVWDTTVYTDWQKELIGNTAHYTDLQASVSGGSFNNSYLVSAGYHRETTVLPTDFNDQKASLHFQINSRSTNQKFNLLFSGSYMIDINRLPHSDITNMAFELAPNAPKLYNEDGSINWAPDVNGNSTWDYPGNPVARFLNKYENKTSNLISNALMSYQIMPGLQIKSSFGYNTITTDETVVIPLSSTAPEFRANTSRIGVYGNSNINSWIIEPQLSYEKNISKGRLEALIGSSIQERNSKGQKIAGEGYASDDVIEDISAASFVNALPILSFTYKYNAVFGRITNTWARKYILNLTARRDGSSRFGEKNRFHNFGSVGASWIFSEEKFIADRYTFLSFGKIKASFGTTGNDQIGDYRFLNTYGPVSMGNPYQGITTLQSNGLANSYLQWEATKKLNFGIDLGLFKDKILINANYFRNSSSNQLLNYQLPITTGFAGITKNFPATVRNTGLELSISTSNIKTKKFKWSSGVNLTVPKNKLVEFPGIESSSYVNYLVVGEPIMIVKRLHLIGVDPTTGVYYFDSKTNPFKPKIPDDATVIINTSPKFYGGFENSLSYNEFQLDFLFQFVKQYGPNYSFGRFPGVARLNQPVYVLDRWQKPGDITGQQRYNSDFAISDAWFNAAFNSDASYEDASYIRLKNISLSFQMPEKLVKTIHLHGLSVYARAQNLLTITNYKGLDPETLSAYSLPPLRVVTVGMKVVL